MTNPEAKRVAEEILKSLKADGIYICSEWEGDTISHIAQALTEARKQAFKEVRDEALDMTEGYLANLNDVSIQTKWDKTWGKAAGINDLVKKIDSLIKGGESESS